MTSAIDIFTFDFRNHGASASDPIYAPLQWVTDHEVRDLRAALAYLPSRPDHDPAGFVLFGVSRGGGTALVVAAGEPDVWGVVTDGAFPTSGTMTAYILRWAEIYRARAALLLETRSAAGFTASSAGSAGARSERRLNCRFPDIERPLRTALARALADDPRRARMPTSARRSPRRLSTEAGEPKEIWIVPGAKHNRCRECEPDGLRRTDRPSFLGRHAPRARPVDHGARRPSS